MNWESKLDSVLTAADDSMAKIKERLHTRGDAAKDFRFDLAPVRKVAPYDDTSACKPASLYAPPTYLHAVQVTSEDMVNLSSQLLSQAKMITSLHQAIGRLERDRDLHLQRIQSLEDEVRRFGASRGADVSESHLERKIEGLRQELSSELRHLEDRVRDSATRGSSPSLRSAASILQEVNETKRLIWKEYECLRRDSDYMRQRLRRQEDDVLRQISEGQELKRVQEKNATALERILSSHQAQTQEMDRTRSDTQSLQRDLQHIRSAIGELRENVRSLEGKVCAQRARSQRPERRLSARRRELSRSSSSSSDDDRSQICLADISSEDTSYSFGAAAEVSRASREQSIASKNGSRRSALSDDDGLDEPSDSGPELNFSDL
ncbi:coiled-coil domain-containing protein 159 [Eleutherodactylus coqui]|uniref:coiled-coil domain-containing protein 159 n=1 Tax=Eleutherodactylus coqui TaxID=57060 RepID=UPI0034638190